MNEHQMTEEELMSADQAFWDFIEDFASFHQVTCDYILEEFIID